MKLVGVSVFNPFCFKLQRSALVGVVDFLTSEVGNHDLPFSLGWPTTLLKFWALGKFRKLEMFKIGLILAVQSALLYKLVGHLIFPRGVLWTQMRQMVNRPYGLADRTLSFAKALQSPFPLPKDMHRETDDSICLWSSCQHTQR